MHCLPFAVSRCTSLIHLQVLSCSTAAARLWIASKSKSFRPPALCACAKYPDVNNNTSRVSVVTLLLVPCCYSPERIVAVTRQIVACQGENKLLGASYDDSWWRAPDLFSSCSQDYYIQVSLCIAAVQVYPVCFICDSFTLFGSDPFFRCFAEKRMRAETCWKAHCSCTFIKKKKRHPIEIWPMSLHFKYIISNTFLIHAMSY